MFDFEDGFTIGSYGVPWLIWIQLLVLFLILFLLYCFTLFASDLSDDAGAAASASPSMSNLGKPSVVKHVSKAVSSHLQNSQVGEIQSNKGERSTSTSRRIVRGDIAEREENATFVPLDPCQYFRLATWAILRCFGIDDNSEDSATTEDGKDR